MEEKKRGKKGRSLKKRYKKMFRNHLKDLILTLIYGLIQILILFCVNLYYIEVATYYLFGKLLDINTLYALTVYEKPLTQLYMGGILTILEGIPIICINIYGFVSMGLYKKEKEKIKKKYKNILAVLVESFISTTVMAPLLTKRIEAKKSEWDPLEIKKNDGIWIMQLTSYSNITEIMGKIIIIWIIMGIIMKISNSRKRKYIPIIILGLSMWVIPPDIKIQSMLTLVILGRLELYIIISYWRKNIGKRKREIRFQ